MGVNVSLQSQEILKDQQTGLLNYSTVVEDPGAPGEWKPTGGRSAKMCRILCPWGGIMEFYKPVKSLYLYFPPQEFRNLFVWINREDVKTKPPAPAMVPPHDPTVPFGFGLFQQPPMVAIQVIGSFMVEDIVYFDE